MPHGMRKIDKLHASTVGSRELKMSMRYWWLSGCMEDLSVHVTSLKLLTARRIQLYSAMPTRSASIRGLANSTYCLERSTLVIQQWRIVCKEVLYLCSFSMACTCSWTATILLSSHISAQQRLNSAIVLEGRPEAGLLAMLPVSQYFSTCKPFFAARTSLTLVKGMVINRTNT